MPNEDSKRIKLTNDNLINNKLEKKSIYNNLESNNIKKSNNNLIPDNKSQVNDNKIENNIVTDNKLKVENNIKSEVNNKLDDLTYDNKLNSNVSDDINSSNDIGLKDNIEPTANTLSENNLLNDNTDDIELYNEFTQLELLMELHIFFTMNKFPYLPNTLPDYNEIKSQIIYYYEKLSKKFINEKDENGNLIKLKKNFIEFFEEKKYKNNNNNLINAIDMFVNTTCIAKIFHMYYFLYNYHNISTNNININVCTTNSNTCTHNTNINNKLSKYLFKTIILFFKSINQKEAINAFRDICIDGRMLNFYIDLYMIYSEELDNALIEGLIQYESY